MAGMAVGMVVLAVMEVAWEVLADMEAGRVGKVAVATVVALVAAMEAMEVVAMAAEGG